MQSLKQSPRHPSFYESLYDNKIQLVATHDLHQHEYKNHSDFENSYISPNSNHHAKIEPDLHSDQLGTTNRQLKPNLTRICSIFYTSSFVSIRKNTLGPCSFTKLWRAWTPPGFPSPRKFQLMSFIVINKELFHYPFIWIFGSWTNHKCNPRFFFFFW